MTEKERGPKSTVLVDRTHLETDVSGISVKHPKAMEISINTELDSLDLTGVVNRSLERICVVCPNAAELDLSPLSVCKNLAEIEIDRCAKLSTIDLSKAHLARLRCIYIHNSGINRINLSCLWRARHLDRLDLSYNRLRTINLKPLSSLRNLSVLHLGGNNIDCELDLRPLASKINLRVVNFLFVGGGRYVRELDISPLFSCLRLMEFRVAGYFLKASKQYQSVYWIWIPPALREIGRVRWY